MPPKRLAKLRDIKTQRAAELSELLKSYYKDEVNRQRALDTARKS